MDCEVWRIELWPPPPLVFGSRLFDSFFASQDALVDEVDREGLGCEPPDPGVDRETVRKETFGFRFDDELATSLRAPGQKSSLSKCRGNAADA